MFEERVLKRAIMKKGETIFDESCTSVEIINEAAGEFVRVKQDNEHVDASSILIDPIEWPTLRDCIDKMIGECREYK